MRFLYIVYLRYTPNSSHCQTCFDTTTYTCVGCYDNMPFTHCELVIDEQTNIGTTIKINYGIVPEYTTYNPDGSIKKEGGGKIHLEERRNFIKEGYYTQQKIQLTDKEYEDLLFYLDKVYKSDNSFDYYYQFRFWWVTRYLCCWIVPEKKPNSRFCSQFIGEVLQAIGILEKTIDVEYLAPQELYDILSVKKSVVDDCNKFEITNSYFEKV